jgi:hypothetical protein
MSKERALTKNQLISMLRAMPGNPYVMVPMDADQRFFAGACSVELSGRERTKVILIRRIKKIKAPTERYIAESLERKKREVEELKSMWDSALDSGDEQEE